MKYLKTFYQFLSKYIDIPFFLKFGILMAGLYYFNIFFIGITDPKGRVYSSFLTNYLDYIAWLRASILYTANLMTNASGLDTYVANIYTLKVVHGQGLRIGFTCIGYGLMSFWVAFIVAQQASWQKKVKWCFAGLAAIWFINCCRVALLLIALHSKWQVDKYITHHDLFNLIAYLLIIVMIHLYYKNGKKKQVMNVSKVASKQRKPASPLIAEASVK